LPEINAKINAQKGQESASEIEQHGGNAYLGNTYMNRLLLFSFVAGSIHFSSHAANCQSPSEKDPSQLTASERSWLETWRFESNKQFQLLTEAYQLDAPLQQKLREDLEARLSLQWEFDQKANAEIAILQAEFDNSGGDEESPEAKRLTTRFAELWSSNPLHEQVVAKALETTLPPEGAATGRARLEALWYRRERNEIVWEEELEYDGAIKKAIVASSINATASKSSSGDPLPHREDLRRLANQGTVEIPAVDDARQPQILMIEMNNNADTKRREATARRASTETAENADAKARYAEDAVAAAETARSGSAPPSVPAGKPQAIAKVDARPPKSVAADGSKRKPSDSPSAAPPKALRATDQTPAAPLPPAPELDEWDKYVDQTAKKYGFDDSQRTKGQAVLKDLRKRAEQYRASRSNDYVQARQNTDAKARAETLKKLNQPIDALFDELKQRLDSLATAQQKAKAAAEPAKKK